MILKQTNKATRRMVSVLFIMVLAGLFSVASTIEAAADAATHKLSITASTLPKTDCGSGGCIPACAVKATLGNTSDSISKPIEIRFIYATKLNDSGEATLTLSFPSLNTGKHNTTRDEVYDVTCERLSFKRIEVVCPEETEEKCPGFYNVEIPDFPLLKIKHQKIEGK